jgi:hypothetical protein
MLQLVRLPNENHKAFIAEAQDVLRAGLETLPWVSVDDTGARHAGKTVFCTQIGNEWSAGSARGPRRAG